MSSKKVFYAIMYFFLAGCGGGISQSSTNKTEDKTPIVSTSDGVRTIELKKDTAIIMDGSCTNEYIYDSQGKTELGRTLKKGKYKIIFTEYFKKYSNSKGVLYYPYSNIILKDTPINKLVELKRGETVLYKLIVLKDQYYVVTQAKAMIYIYNEEFKKIATSWAFDEAQLMIAEGNSFELKKGTYYIQGNAHNCDEGGSFKLIEL
ncbi:hypothetical protein MNB_SV-14-953 [hydrothermal vent metagenome]|uniref:Lipoprotein n=1 Tax=hydrothermal vent metagenome TaxID=652676 RepID=A0A1W1CQ08_9ZZZZ